jgi:hypothetical protein
MYSRVTLLEIDTMRIDVDDAVAVFKEQVLPELRELEGFAGVIVLATPEGKGMIVSVWETEEAASAAAPFATSAVEDRITLFRAPPGREHYEVVFAEMPGVLVA